MASGSGMGLVDSADSIDTAPGPSTSITCSRNVGQNCRATRSKYVRLFPVWREVNRSAGGGRERLDPHTAGFKPHRMKSGIYFATDLQVRKMLNHPVGSSTDRTEIFKRR